MIGFTKKLTNSVMAADGEEQDAYILCVDEEQYFDSKIVM